MKETYTKEEVLKLLQEQKYICERHADHANDFEDALEAIKNAPLATGESNYIAIEKEKFQTILIMALNIGWEDKGYEVVDKKLIEEFGIDLN